MLISKSANTPKWLLPHAVTVTRQATTRPIVSSWSLVSPRTISSIKGYSAWWRNVLSRLDKLDKLNKAHNPAPKVKKIWVRNDETINSLRGVDSPSSKWVLSMPKIMVLILEHVGIYALHLTFIVILFWPCFASLFGTLSSYFSSFFKRIFNRFLWG
jgi:hypothetical protein